METTGLGSAGPEVTTLGLGCNNFGMKLDERETREVVHAALDAGIRHFDTAEVYGGGQSEAFLGKALGNRRSDVVIATKFAPRQDSEPYQPGLLRRRILEGCETSLRRDAGGAPRGGARTRPGPAPGGGCFSEPGHQGGVPVVLDPVIAAKNGVRPTSDETIRVLKAEVFPKTNVLTPNLKEAALLAGCRSLAKSEMEARAQSLSEQFGLAVVIKGGHLLGTARDVFFGDGEMSVHERPRLPLEIHGTGCTLSALLCVFLARGYPP